MLQTIEGIYENGRVELLETPSTETVRARVIVTFLTVENEMIAASESENEEKLKNFAEAAKDLIGSVKSGLPSDLSTNKAYMGDFGRD